jgi:mannitol 2-dehydrogenase
MTTDSGNPAVALSPGTLGELEPGRVAIPGYDRTALRTGIVHFGVGGFHRAHQAKYVDTLLGAGLAPDWAICGVGLLATDAKMAAVMADQDCLYTLIEKSPDGTVTARVIGSIIDYLFAPDDPAAVLDRLADPAVRIVTMTVTEAGYNMHRVTGEFVADGPGIADDLAQPDRPATVFGFVAEALARRRAAATAPFAVVSCDNLPGNGTVCRRAVVGFARLRDPELADWIDAEVSFPNSMVDRITPATDDDDRVLARERFGVADAWPVVCEPFTQWVLEDDFPCGRPPFEQAGAQLVSDVEPYELMKLRLLNASHQALGYAGYLAGYRYVHEAMGDPAFVALVRDYMRGEAVASLRPVPGIDLDGYIDELVERFTNPAIRDTLARLCVDSSERMPKFLLPVLRYQLGNGGPIQRSVAVIACWARYCDAVDEVGASIDIVDPAREALTAAAAGRADDPLSFVRNADIFGELADDERFATAYLAALDSVYERGARATVAALSD